MKSYPNQTSFSQGELSPLMRGRTDLELYSDAVQLMVNIYADAHGPAVGRHGMKRMIEYNGANARLEVLPRTANTFFTFVFLDLQLLLIRDITAPVTETYAAPWTDDQLDDIQIVSLPEGDSIYFLHPNVQTQRLVDQTEGTQTQEFMINGNFIVPAGITDMTACVCGGGGGGGGALNVPADNIGGSGGGGSGVVKTAITVVPAENISITIGAAGNGGGAASSGGAGGSSVLTYSGGSVTSSGGSGGATSSGPGVGGSGGGSGGNLGGAGGGTSATCDSSVNSGGSSPCVLTLCGGGGGGGGYGNGGNAGSQYQVGNPAPDPNSGGGGGGAGGGFGSGGNGSAGRIVLSWEVPGAGFVLTPVAFVNAPTNWTGTNWPSAGTYYQGRMWLGGAPNLPEQFLGSMSDTPENFTLGPNANDAISHTIRKFGGIEWMGGTKRLLIGTSNGEYIAIAESGLLKPGDLEVLQQSSYGSASLQAETIGDQVLYVSADRRKVRAMNYKWEENNWFSVDLTFPSEHITYAKVNKLSWSQHPDNLLWCLMDDGTFATATYNRSVNVFGWHRHNTDGIVLSAAVGFDGNRSILILAIIRSSGSISIEYLSDEYSMDSWVETTNINVNINGQFNANGFNHLEGKSVQVVVDGNIVHPDRIVGADSSPGAGDGIIGRIYLTKGFNKVAAGLQFIPELTTLDFDGGVDNGSGLSHKKRRNSISIKLLNSGYPLVNGKRGDDRSPSTPMGSAEPLFTGTRKYTGLGWDENAIVNIKQDLPLPLTILAIYGEIDRNAF